MAGTDLHSGGDLLTRREIVIQISTGMVLTKLLVVAALGVSMWECGICITSVRYRRWGCW